VTQAMQQTERQKKKKAPGRTVNIQVLSPHNGRAFQQQYLDNLGFKVSAVFHLHPAFANHDIWFYACAASNFYTN
jgi:hypothetical protein